MDPVLAHRPLRVKVFGDDPPHSLCTSHITVGNISVWLGGRLQIPVRLYGVWLNLLIVAEDKASINKTWQIAEGHYFFFFKVDSYCFARLSDDDRDSRPG